MAEGGRPTKYTPETEEKILNALRNGNTRKASSEAAGITYTTFAEWVKEYPEFSESVIRAEAEAEQDAVNALRKGFQEDGDWRAAESWLKRRRNREWGDRKQVDVKDLSTEQILALLENEGEVDT